MTYLASEIEGRWEKLVRPIADGLELPGRMGMPVTLQADSARDIGKAIVMLAQCIDGQEALEVARKKLWRSVTATLAMAVTYCVLWWLYA